MIGVGCAVMAVGTPRGFVGGRLGEHRRVIMATALGRMRHRPRRRDPVGYEGHDQQQAQQEVGHEPDKTAPPGLKFQPPARRRVRATDREPPSAAELRGPFGCERALRRTLPTNGPMASCARGR